MLLTYRTGQSALAAVSESNMCIIAEQTVRVSLLTSEWRERIEDELSLTRSNTTAMYSATTNSLLGEDFSIPSMSFDMDGEWLRCVRSLGFLWHYLCDVAVMTDCIVRLGSSYQPITNSHYYIGRLLSNAFSKRHIKLIILAVTIMNSLVSWNQ
jgi:Domain of unknown function (DUF1866)